jgi:hypothetical protein
MESQHGEFGSMRTRGAIKDVVVSWLSENVVDSVQVENGLDSDGDAIINITVVLKHNAKPDRRKMVGLVRHLRERLPGSAFSLVEFISQSDAKRKRAAA